MAEFGNICAELIVTRSGATPILADLIPAMEGLSELLVGVAKPTLLADLSLLIDVAHDRGDVSIDAFASAIREHVASLSKRRPRSGAAPLNQHLVDDYL